MNLEKWHHANQLQQRIKMLKMFRQHLFMIFDQGRIEWRLEMKLFGHELVSETKDNWEAQISMSNESDIEYFLEMVDARIAVIQKEFDQL